MHKSPIIYIIIKYENFKTLPDFEAQINIKLKIKHEFNSTLNPGEFISIIHKFSSHNVKIIQTLTVDFSESELTLE